MTSSIQTVGGWLPADPKARAAFRKDMLAKAQADGGADVPPPSVLQFYQLISSDPLLRMQISEAILQANTLGYDPGYTSIAEMMQLIEQTVTHAFPYTTGGLVGCPLNLVFDPIMNVTAGYAFFRDTRVNAALAAMLSDWCSFLKSPASTTYLTDALDGWFGPAALDAIDMSLFECDPSAPHWGFANWDAYFTRKFKPGVRPIAGVGNPKIISNSCESAGFALQQGVSMTDTFWIKSQPYSLSDMFGADNQDLAKSFDGGDVYQAFLSAHNYHCWNAPVSGTVVAHYNLPGTYYSDAESEGYDPAGPNLSQGYLSSVAARAVIAIDTGDPVLGVIAVIYIGMAEISSNVFSLPPPDPTTQTITVKRGDVIGAFHYGGSTHCVITKQGAIKDWHVTGPPFDFNAAPNPVNSLLATAF